MLPGPGVPPRPLLLLVAAVGLLHGLALRATPDTLSWPRRGSAPVWTVRTVALPAAAPAAAAAAPPAAAAAPARPRVATALPPQRRPAPSLQASPSPPQPVPAPAASLSPQVAVPAAATWHYTVSALHRGLPVAGRAQLAWRHDGRRYEASLHWQVPPLPAREQHSAGELGAQGLVPLRFSDRLRSEAAAHFDRAGGRIVFSSNRPAAALREGAQDRLSVLLQLAAVFAAQPARLRTGDTLVVQTATAHDADDWHFTLEGEEMLDLPAGPVRAVKLTRAAQREYDLRLELWLAPGPDYGPVRLRLTPPHGDWLELQWSGTDKG